MEKPTKQRLAVFLDGTWNTEDDSTNVLNAYHNTEEGCFTEQDEDGNDIIVEQKRYYDRGVGTTVSDNVRGGGYGLGLEKNVREAYNWLVDNYNGMGKDDPDADEIYIFGFSRGAYTARSLVGLIGACGLVKRGAPITVTQLYNGYAFISKNRSQDKDWWKAEMEKEENKNLFGRLSDYKRREPKNIHYNKSEKLLSNWSKRVNITYLGIYDTVGAMGIHALGIPGLRSKLDSTHNLNPTKLIQRCRHALAIDEHRTNFRITPILNYIDHENPKSLDAYKEKILQRWFTGAHSNIGGGYENNILSMRPYKWIMDGANDSNLTNLRIISKHKQVSTIEAENSKVDDIRDSYAELAGKVYPHIFRSKRHFRPVGRADLVRGGYSLSSINEDIDPFVYELLDSAVEEKQKQKTLNEDAEKSAIYAPPNLLSYIERHNPKAYKSYESLEHQHSWPGELMSYSSPNKSIWSLINSCLLAIFWSITASYGLIRLYEFFWGDITSTLTYSLAVIACIFIIADWGEHRANISRNFYPKAVKLDVTWNILYWIRLLSIISFFVGFFCFIAVCFEKHPDTGFTFLGIWEFIKIMFAQLNTTLFYYALASASALTFILHFFGNYPRVKMKDKYQPTDFKNLKLRTEESKLNKYYLGSIIVFSFATVLFFIFKYWNNIKIQKATETTSSRLLLIFLLVYASTKIIEWVGKSMGKFEANIGSIGIFQTTFTKSDISNVLNHWLSKIHRPWLSKDDKRELVDLNLEVDKENDEENKLTIAWLRLREILRKAIWRDIVGFVPLYSFIMVVILSTGFSLLCPGGNEESLGIFCIRIFDTIPLWLGLVIATAIFDQIENGVELIHIDNHPTGGSNLFWRLLGIVATLLKYIGFFTLSFLCAAVIIYLVVINISSDGEHWKWVLANVAIYIGIVSAIIMVGKAIFMKFFK